MDDESFVNNFVSNQKFIRNPTKQVSYSVISEIRDSISQAYNLNKQLKNLKSDLENCSPDEATDKLLLIDKLKNDTKDVLKNIRSEKLDAIKLKLKKRNYLKRKKVSQKKELIQSLKNESEKRYYSNLKIDNWMKKKMDEVEKEKQAKNLSKNADIILYDVKNNRSTARKFLTVLKKLQDLRKIKTTIVKSQGGVISAEADQVFVNIVEKLQQNWTALDKMYMIEEKGLKLMIKDDEKKFSSSKKNTFDDWEVVLFGKKVVNNVGQSSINFPLLRTMWDTFINIAEGSEIPVGWVVPHDLFPSSSK